MKVIIPVLMCYKTSLSQSLLWRAFVWNVATSSLYYWQYYHLFVIWSCISHCLSRTKTILTILWVRTCMSITFLMLIIFGQCVLQWRSLVNYFSLWTYSLYIPEIISYCWLATSLYTNKSCTWLKSRVWLYYGMRCPARLQKFIWPGICLIGLYILAHIHACITK